MLQAGPSCRAQHSAWWEAFHDLQDVWAVGSMVDLSSAPRNMTQSLARTRVAAVRALESTCRGSMSAQRRQMRQTAAVLEV
jgi:hypothetical protein